MRPVVQVQGDVPGFLAAQTQAIEDVTTAAVDAVTREVKDSWRAQVRGALGGRLAGAVRGVVYPNNTTSLNAAGLVYTNAPKIIAAHERGATIRSRHGRFLAIPTPAAGKGAVTPGEWQFRNGRKLTFVPTGGGRAVLVAEGVRVGARGAARVMRRVTRSRATTAVPIFVLVPVVKLPKRLDLLGSGKAIGGTLSGRLRAAIAGVRARG